jgi:adenylate cyclase
MVVPSSVSDRKLSCPVFADLVGYSAVVEENETRTLAAVESILLSIVTPAIGRHRGRLIRTTGDGFFADFASASDAVRCSIEIQRAMVARNDNPRLAFRVGINFGEVTEKAGEIFGQNVNVAARLETLCEPEGVCISSTVREAIAGQVDAVFHDGGIRTLKNMKRPVHVWLWSPEQRNFGTADSPAGPFSLPTRPSLAVLPFTSLVEDPEQDYFTDGLVEEIITALARVRWFFVISRNSSFGYKGRSVDVREVSRELGVRYVLEGSVRKQGDRVRIAVQLLDGTNGSHLWAETITGTLGQIFELQDMTAQSIAGAIEPKLRSAEIERARRKPTENLDAYDLYLRALPHIAAGSAGDVADALSLLRQAVALDADYAQAYAAIAWCRELQFLVGAVTASAEFFTDTCALARKAVQLDPGDAEILSTAALVVTLMAHDYGIGREWADASTRLNPSSSQAWARSAMVRCWTSEFTEGANYFSRAIRLSPTDPQLHIFQTGLGMAYTFLQDWPAAVDWLRRALSKNEHFAPAYRFLAVALVRSGRLDEARDTVRKLLTVDPLSSLARSRRYTGFRDAEPKRLYLESLRAAGLPE